MRKVALDHGDIKILQSKGSKGIEVPSVRFWGSHVDSLSATREWAFWKKRSEIEGRGKGRRGEGKLFLGRRSVSSPSLPKVTPLHITGVRGQRRKRGEVWKKKEAEKGRELRGGWLCPRGTSQYISWIRSEGDLDVVAPEFRIGIFSKRREKKKGRATSRT